jgi:YD repeat-containing protein
LNHSSVAYGFRNVTLAPAACPVTRSDYNLAGNKTKETDRLGRLSPFFYDAADRLVEERWQASATAAVFHTITRVYDVAQLANVADGERRDGGPPLPVGGLVPGQHGADFGDATVWAAAHGEAFQRKWGPCTVSQHVFETPTIARNIAVDERDPDACVDRKHAVLPGNHVGGRIGIEELLHTEPPHDATPHPLGERGQMDLSNRPGRQKHWPGAAVCTMWRPLQDRHKPCPLHENASGGLKGASRRKLPWQPNAIRSRSSAVAMRV